MLRITRIACLASLLLLACDAKQETTGFEQYLLELQENYTCQNPRDNRFIAVFGTKLGNFSLELLPNAAPITAENFACYLGADFFQNTIVHKISDGFVVQMGLYDLSCTAKEPILPPIINEANRNIEHRRGTVAMVRYEHPDSATSEFLINIADNPLLEFANGYTVFAIIDSGMDVIDKIASQQVDGGDQVVIHETQLIIEPCNN